MKSKTAGTLVFKIDNNNWGAYPGAKKGTYYASAEIRGGDEWQTVMLSVEDFKAADERTKVELTSWKHITELGICGRMAITKGGKRVEVPAHTNKPLKAKSFRNLRWVGGTYSELDLGSSTKVLSEEEYKKQFQRNIDDSIEQEKREGQ